MTTELYDLSPRFENFPSSNINLYKIFIYDIYMIDYVVLYFPKNILPLLSVLN